jgi:NTP pyrophosphatase (non-canonical NTP hydrolase)
MKNGNHTDDLQALMDEILYKNELYFPGWEDSWLFDEAKKHYYWTNAMAGEVGELCNASKKHGRFLDSWGGKKLNREEYNEFAAEELADIFIYVVLYSKVLDIDLIRAIRLKVDENYKERFKVE